MQHAGIQGKPAILHIFNADFKVFRFALMNWPIPLLVVGLSDHFRDAPTLLDNDTEDVRLVRSKLINFVSISLHKEHSDSPFFHRHLSQMSERLEVNSVKYYSILCLCFSSVYFQAIMKKAEINMVIFALYFYVEIKRQCRDNTILQHHFSMAHEHIVNDPKWCTLPHKGGVGLPCVYDARPISIITDC